VTTATAKLDVHLIFRRDADVLVSLRAGDVYGSGEWALPCGKVHPGETLPAAAVREAFEELGVTIDPDHLAVGHTVHIHDGDTAHLGVFFEVRTWAGTVHNREPDKCGALRWTPLADLPHPLMDYSAAGLHGYTTMPGGLSSYDVSRRPTTLRPVDGTPLRPGDHE
jgi:8-oxo-dGTP pyrophosphatase MutT (NUDIX family)